MLKGLKNKLLAGLVTCACLFAGAGFGVGVKVASADVEGDNPSVTDVTAPFTQGSQEEGAYSLEIVSKNVSYSDSIYILYAVANEGFDRAECGINLLFWNEPQSEYVVGTEAYSAVSAGLHTIGEKSCLVFYSDGIAAKEMNDMLYCRAYASVDGVAVYSEVEKYSVVDYVYEMREKELTEEQTNVFADMLDYGTSAQKLFGYNADRLANATYYTVTVENGTLEDGFTWGRYALNATATLIANVTDGGNFSHWEDESGVNVGGESPLPVTVTGNKTYTAVYVQETPANAFQYLIVNNESVKITKYIGEYTDVIIPSKIANLPVTEIGIKAFYQCRNLTSVVIPNSVMSIGDEAFEYCRTLKSVVIGDGVTSVAMNAFYWCTNLTRVVLGDSVTSIGYGAFSGCELLSDLEIPNTVNNIEHQAFFGCSRLNNLYIMDLAAWCQISGLSNLMSYGSAKNLYLNNHLVTELVIPNGVTTIDELAFANCWALKSVVIPDSVVSISDKALQYCWNLTNISVAEENAFYQAIDGNLYTKDGVTLVQYAIGKKATEFVIPNGVISIGDVAFYQCSNLASVVIPDSVTSIGDRTFYNCSKLTSVMIGDGVTSIGYAAFYDCTSLTSVIIGDSVEIIDDTAFGGRNSLQNVYIKDITTWCNISGLCSLMASVKNLYINDSLVTELVIPHSVTSICSWVFYNCSSLTSVVIPDSVTTIGDYAFYNCSSLTSVVIPDSVTSIGEWAFANCSSLTSVLIGDSVTSIGRNAFYGCSSLTIYCEAESQPEGWNVNWNSSNRPVVWGYKPATPASAFEYTSDGESVTITKYVGEYADVVIPSTIDGLPVKSIGYRAFYDCSSLTSVEIGDSVTSIGNMAFERCTNLVSIVMSNSLIEIGDFAFSNCESLNNIVIPYYVRKIGYAAFTGSGVYYATFENPKNWSCNGTSGAVLSEEELRDDRTAGTYLRSTYLLYYWSRS